MEQIFEGAYRSGRFSGIPAHTNTLTKAEVLDEANQSFTYRGQPIHPGLVQEFECWISDLNPVTFVVDVSAAFDANEYSQKVYIQQEYATIETAEGPGAYGYKRISNSADGIQTLTTRYHEGGSSSFGSDLWVTFELGVSFFPSGEPYDQLLMRLIRVQ